MKVIGLTGGTGSGKGVVSNFLKEQGLYIIDTDKIAHDIILKGQKAYSELVEFFGSEILGDDGEIVRKKLGEIVFTEGGQKLSFLNKCTHKYIFEEIEKEISIAKKEDYKAAIVDAPLLIEGDFITLCDEVWVVYADKKVREERIMARDNITRQLAQDRISKQKDWEEYKKYADIVLDNSSTLEEIKKQAEKAMEISFGV